MTPSLLNSLPRELQYLVLQYLDISMLLHIRYVDSKYQDMVKQILLAYHNPLDVMLYLVPPQDIDHYNQTISQSRSITLDFIERHIDNIDWRDLSYNPALTPDIIDAYANKLRWGSHYESGLSGNPALIGQGVHPQSIEVVISLLRKHHRYIVWSRFSDYQKLTIPIIEGVIDYIKWEKLPYNKHLSSGIIEHYLDRIDVTVLLISGKITREFLINNHHKFTHWIDVTEECLKRWPELIIEYPEWPWTW